jgi:hypothetical protein
MEATTTGRDTTLPRVGEYFPLFSHAVNLAQIVLAALNCKGEAFPAEEPRIALM